MARARFRFIVAVALWLASPLGRADIVPPLPQPSWAELSPEQKQILNPLASEWNKMDGFRRKKWLGIAQNYRSMNADEKTRMQRRMTDWAELTPDERKRAREKYKSLQKSPQASKDAVKLKWQEYKELPESEKKRLKAEAAQKPSSRPSPLKKPAAPKVMEGEKASRPDMPAAKTESR